MAVRRLPPTLIDQIAAGEVVERPSSVVKELVENALDAGAHQVEIDLDGGGLARIVVADDGSGMSRADAELAVERHATSKIASVDDLLQVGTYGFRGEALPSIASVSRFTLLTSTALESEGTRVVVDGGRRLAVEPASRRRGTTIEVLDLFANVPARRKFLKSADAERRRVVAALEATSMARPEVGFRLRANGAEILNLEPRADLALRLRDLLGDDVGEWIPIDKRMGDLVVSGFVSSSTFGTRQRQHLFVRGRPISDRGLARAIAQGCAEALRQSDRHPAVALFLDLPPEMVDVNVHPAKSEVRFRTGVQVFPLVFAAVRDALIGAAAGQSPRPSALGRLLSPEPRGEWKRPASSRVAEAQPLPFVDPEPPPRADLPAATMVGQIAATYLLAEANDGGLILVDQHTAHERILYEGIRDRLERERLPAQRLIEAQIFRPSVSEAGQLEAHEAELAQAGFEVAALAGGEWGLVTVPEMLKADPLAVLRELLADLGEDDAAESALFDRLGARLACRSAVMKGDDVSPLEADRLFRDLGRVRDPHRCPHGRRIWARLDKRELDRLFGR